MSKEHTPFDDKTLEFEEATELTVEEAVQKEADLAAGITEEDSILDKYIKRNRDKVGELKFDNQGNWRETPELDTTSLDNFIEKQREDLSETLVAGAPLLASEFDEETDTVEQPTAAPVFFDEETDEDDSDTFYGTAFTTDEKPVYRHKKLIIGSVAALLLSTVGIAYGLNQLNKQGTTVASSSSSTSATASQTSSSSSSKASATDVKAFDDLYKTFFADETATKPKNSEFGKLSQLEDALKKLEGTADYTAAKAKYDSLSKAIEAINAINDKFETPAIVDGVQVAATLVAGANLDDLSSTILKTGSASLDSLLQSVIKDGRQQAQSSVTPASQPNGTTASTTSGEQPTSPAVTEVLPAEKTAPTTAVSGLQREVSRVPYDAAAIADTTNSAWTFNPGVLEEILRVSHERGYFSGDQYILEPVAIINGNGYYNLFKSDGTYLFSINAKTGYFVGNGAGYADDLDY